MNVELRLDRDLPVKLNQNNVHVYLTGPKESGVVHADQDAIDGGLELVSCVHKGGPRLVLSINITDTKRLKMNNKAERCIPAGTLVGYLVT